MTTGDDDGPLVVPLSRLAGRVCVVTGSTGMAAAAAARFAAEGASVFATSRTEAHLRDLVAGLVARGAPAGYAVADLEDEGQVEAAIGTAVERFGRIDGLFSVAGGSGRRFGDGPIHELTAEGWDRTLDLNLRTQALVARAVVRRMLAQPGGEDGRRGAILMMSSALSTDPVPELFATHAYAAAKGAINALTTTMAAYYAPHGIRVNALAPSLVRTPMSRRAASDPVTSAFARRKMPLAPDFVDPDEVAAAAAFLLSDESRSVTGQLLKIDGGWSVTSAIAEDPGS